MAQSKTEAASVLDPRVGLAAERTLLAWVRTGLAMMGFGFVVARFGLLLSELAATRDSAQDSSSSLSLWLGSGLIVLGTLVNLMAAAQHIRLLRRIDRGEGYRPAVWSLGVVVTFVLAALGIILAGYLLLGDR